jgi:hypothetical protein
VAGLHDFRALHEHRPTEDQARRLEWRASDADLSFVALLSLHREGTPDGEDVVGPMTITGQFPPVWPPNGWRLYGDSGMLIVEKLFAPVAVFRQRDARAECELLEVPRELREGAPATGDALVDMWTILFRDFVSDIQGTPGGPYPTFRDGWRLQVAIDAIRSGVGWTNLPDRDR